MSSYVFMGNYPYNYYAIYRVNSQALDKNAKWIRHR